MTGSVAVIGAGPGGLVTARWLLSQGFEPTIFEQAPTLGGQWTGLDGISGVWPTMHTNTSRILTSFSDLPHERDLVFPSNQDMLAYLHRYAETFALTSRIRFGTRVDNLSRGENSWLVAHSGTIEAFERVVVASGRFQSPFTPSVPGLDTFVGSAGVMSTFRYRDSSPYLGKRVLVGGGAISALEIATELAHLGVSVTITQRRQRYVLPKFAAGVPSDSRIFTRYGTLANEMLPSVEVDRQLKEIVIEAGGSPEQYGAPAPDPSLFAAGVTLAQQYLPLVAEGRIMVRPWIASVDGRTVTFADGSSGQFDGILFGTGFVQSLPFLSDEIKTIVGLDSVHLDADRSTFHPDLPGLAFVGMWDQSGGYFVPLELQARWIAYSWSGIAPRSSPEDQHEAISIYRASRGISQKSRMNLMAMTFARAAGVEPHLENWQQLHRALLFGPLAPSCFRLEGPDALPDAPVQFARDAAAFGAITANELTPREEEYMTLLEAAAVMR
jgi:dimethylaniline monooxygenase (N-oxide forming)